MRLNMPNEIKAYTHEGGRAHAHLSPLMSLKRSVMACLLWEDTFYEDGQSIADRIVDSARKAPASDVATLAVEARSNMHLRHVPLLLLSVLAETPEGKQTLRNTIPRVVQRADELAELLAVYWRDGRKPVPRQMKIGLAKALEKFDEYQLAKYDRDGAIKLRDVLRIVRPKPSNDDNSALYKKVVARTLKTPDTWEVELSGGRDKRETFERLIRENKLGYLALLRNLRNMSAANVERSLVNDAIRARKNGAHRVLPFRFVGAINAAPEYGQALDESFRKTINELNTLPGATVVLVDVSGSMNAKLSSKSDLTRMDAAAALGSIVPSSDLRVFTFSQHVVEVPAWRGMAGIEAIKKSQPWGGTYLADALKTVNERAKYDRIIVITDEQSHDGVGMPADNTKGYLINVASYKNGVGYGKWTHIDGFSENVIRYIQEHESFNKDRMESQQ